MKILKNEIFILKIVTILKKSLDEQFFIKNLLKLKKHR
jgi:hypothetical protein